jgi:hypothetical protein
MQELQVLSGDVEDVGSERPVLIKLDPGFIARIEAERDALTGGTGCKVPRTAMIRMLLKEALDARARSRGETVPMAIEVGQLGGD